MALKLRSLSINLPFGIGGISIDVDEAQWPELAAFYHELGDLRRSLLTYVDALAQIAGVHQATSASPQGMQ